MSDINRREAIKFAAMTTATLAATTLSSTPLFAAAKKKEKSVSEPFKLQFEDVILKPLPFDPKKLQGISEKLILSHHENNYGGSVKALNAVNKKLAAGLAEKDFPPFAFCRVS